MGPSFASIFSDTFSKMKDFGFFPKRKYVRNVPELARKKEQPRNEKCNCGSDKKYKNCCGK